MRLKRYPTAAAFMDDALDVLKLHEIQNNLLYRNIGDGNIMLTVQDEDGRVLIAADRTPPHPMVMYERGNLHDERTVEFFARSLFESGLEIDLFMAGSELARSFLKHYSKASGKRFENNQRLKLSVADHAQAPERIARGNLRPATEDDLYFLPYWCADFSIACSIGAYDLKNSQDSAKRLVEARQIYLWEDGVPVSMAAAHRRVTGCRFIGYVYTPPQLRGRGYASACVYSLTRDLLTEAYPKCALYVNCDNPVAGAIYEKIGYRPTGIVEQYREIPPVP